MLVWFLIQNKNTNACDNNEDIAQSPRGLSPSTLISGWVHTPNGSCAAQPRCLYDLRNPLSTSNQKLSIRPTRRVCFTEKPVMRTKAKNEGRCSFLPDELPSNQATATGAQPASPVAQDQPHPSPGLADPGCLLIFYRGLIHCPALLFQKERR